jgi:SAM-dependent methyltransferase
MLTNSSLHDREPGTDSSATAWRRFWSTGAVDTFGSTMSALLSPEGSGSPPLVSHWRRWMRDLPTHGEVLDVGSGNGVLLSHLLIALPASPVRGVGVDVTQPSLAWLEAFAPDQRLRIECHAGVAAENLPFETGRFVASTSQFGIEYADMSQAVPEVLRVLKPGARIGWAIHHDAGRPALLAREELGHIEWLEHVGWFEAVGKVAASMSAGHRSINAPAPDSTEWASFERLVQKLKKREAESSCPDVLGDLVVWTNQCLNLSRRYGAQRGLAYLEQMQQLLADSRTRLLDLTGHTLSEAAWMELLRNLQELGVATHSSTGPLFDRGHLMGWWLDGQLAW